MTVEGFDQQNAAERPAKIQRAKCRPCQRRRLQSLALIATAVLAVADSAMGFAVGDLYAGDEQILPWLLAGVSVPIFAIGWSEWQAARRGCTVR